MDEKPHADVDEPIIMMVTKVSIPIVNRRKFSDELV